MINQIACYMANKMRDSKVIDEDNIELYVFGIEIFLITLIKGIGNRRCISTRYVF